MADLTLSGSIGLLRRGSPLYAQGVVVGINPEMEDNLTHLVCLHEGNQDFCDPAGLELDLFDATGRAHAAWWLAAKVAKRQPIMAARLRYKYTDHGGFGWWLTWDSPGVAGEDCLHQPGDDGPLATLDPNDPRTLPDGSRWVNAEALRLFCLHVAGMGGDDGA